MCMLASFIVDILKIDNVGFEIVPYELKIIYVTILRFQFVFCKLRLFITLISWRWSSNWCEYTFVVNTV